MHPALLFTARYGPDIAEWLFANRDRIGSGFERFGAPVFDTLSGRSRDIERMGATLVSQQRNGQSEVIGLLHRQDGRLDDIGRAVDGVADAVRGVAEGQAWLADSLGLLTSLSAVTLGFSVLTPAILVLQFRALSGRLDGLARAVKAIQVRLDTKYSSELDAGLTKLSIAGAGGHRDGATAREFLREACGRLIDSGAYYAGQLGAELSAGPRANRAFAWLLARHLAVAALGTAACHLRMGDSGLAAGALRRALPPLRQHAAAVFARTVGAGASPMRYLMPAMKEHGATLESMAELYRQAEWAGALEPASRRSAVEFFEDLRGRMGAARDPWLGKASAVRRMRCELAEATAAVEEVNRIGGLVLTLDHCATQGRDYLELEREILADLRGRAPVEGSCYAYFPTIAGDSPSEPVARSR